MWSGPERTGGTEKMDGTAQHLAAARSIDSLRLRLLDLKNSNRLISFKHSEKGRTHIRIIDELPNVLFDRLSGTVQGLTFRSLPEQPDDPVDEKTEVFELALEEVRVTDAEYLAAIERADDDPASKEARRVERALRDRVRLSIGMAPWKSHRLLSIAEYAESLGLRPSYDLLESDGQFQLRHDDAFIQTLLLPDQMERKLSGLADLAKTSMRETGINTLYAVFGFLGPVIA
jgi:hypothetical protein